MKAEIKNIDLEIEKMEYIECAAIGYSEKSAPTNAFSSSVENEVVIREKKKQQLECLNNEIRFNRRVDLYSKGNSSK